MDDDRISLKALGAYLQSNIDAIASGPKRAITRDKKRLLVGVEPSEDEWAIVRTDPMGEITLVQAMWLVEHCITFVNAHKVWPEWKSAGVSVFRFDAMLRAEFIASLCGCEKAADQIRSAYRLRWGRLTKRELETLRGALESLARRLFIQSQLPPIGLATSLADAFASYRQPRPHAEPRAIPPPATSGPGFTLLGLASKLKCDTKTVTRYAKRRGLPTPAVGQKSFVYSDDDAQMIMEFAAQLGGSRGIQEQAALLLAERDKRPTAGQ